MMFLHARWSRTIASALLVSALAACGGSGGDDAPAVDNTPPVPVPTGTSPITLTANTPPATFAALQIKATVGRITVSSPPVVNFALTDQDGNAIIGFGSTSQSATAPVASYPNLAFSLAKLVPGSNGSPSKWVSYIVTTVPSTTTPAAPTRPTTDSTGTLVDNKNGTYTYTFYRDVTKIKDEVAAMTVSGSNNKADLGDLTWEPNLTHRLTIQISGNAPGTGTNTANAVQTAAGVPLKNPVDVVHDFIPATGKPVSGTDFTRDIAANAKCEECHRRLGGIPGDSAQDSAASFHGGSRNEVRYCVVCHTDQRKYGRPEATYNAGTNSFSGNTYITGGRTIGDLPNFIHKTHLGEALARKNYNYAGVLFNEVRYPQDIRNCTKCHDGSDTSTAKTAQGDNWKTAPSTLACGSCHDGIDFKNSTGVTLKDALAGKTFTNFRGFGAHGGGKQADDSKCSNCHTADALDINHLPVTPPNPGNSLLAGNTDNNTNSAWIASNTSRLPAGAVKVSYEIKSVSRNADKRPVMVFRMLQNGVVKPLNNFATAAVNPATNQKEIWDGFMGSPSVYFVFGVPQDGIATPSDFNATASSYLRSLWNGTAAGGAAGTLTGPDPEGWYTATITGSTVPDGAVMLTGGLGYSYNVRTTLPLTQTNLLDYPAAAATATGLNPTMPNATGGLIVIAPNVQKVADGYTGRRAIVEDKRCNACHQELGTFTEDAFHAGQRNDGTTCSWCHTPNRASYGWSADSLSFVHATHGAAKRTVPYTWHNNLKYWEVTYPGVLSQCESCHLPGTFDYSAPGSAAALPNKQARTVASGTLTGVNTGPDQTLFTLSPYVTAGLAYGSGFSFSAVTGTSTAAAPTTLVTSPMATVCFACHDSTLAQLHITTNGGSLYEARSTALVKTEQCALCHAPGKVADIKVQHSK